MIRSLRTGVTGLRGNQLRLDAIGNNIANVNTTGFKRSRVLFQETLAQRIATGGRLVGSTSPGVSNIGNGGSVGAVDQVWSQGSLTYTNLPTDLAIAGDGFFVAGSSQGNMLTRAGAFTFDAEGFLVTPDGLRLQGWRANTDGEISTGALKDIRIDPSTTSAPVRTSEMTISGNLSAERPVDATDPLTMSSVIYDGQGRAHTVIVTVAKTADDTWSVTSAEIAGDPDTDPPVIATPLNVTGDDLAFDADGMLTAGGEFVIDGAFPDGSALSIDLDIRDTTQFGGSSTASVETQNGSPAGDLVDFGFDQTGTLILAFSNGVRRPAAQMALGMVSNPDGLDQVGDGFYATSSASGDMRIGRAGGEIPSAVIAGALEASNVDLAEEFTDMIVAQRGYQANARVITTSDELLQETVQLKR
ncbi:MAG: flagellar hook protein FlgE [Rubricoccaceae bacterium]